MSMLDIIKIITICILCLIEIVSIIISIKLASNAEDRSAGMTLGLVYTSCATAVLLIGLGFIMG